MADRELKLAAVAAAFSSDVRATPGLARRAGVSGLLFDARTPALDLAELSATGRREFLHLLSSQAQQLVGLRHDLGPKGLGTGGDIDRELARLRIVMETAHGLAAPLVCVDLGPVPAPIRTEPPKPKITSQMAGLILLPDPSGEQTKPVAAAAAEAPDPALLSQIDAALVELGRLADRTSTVLAFRSELSPLSALERALRAADCPWFGIDLDPAAILSDAWDLDETFSHLGPHVRHVRGRDALKGSQGRTKPAPIGQADTDWTHLLANLDDVDYRGWITIDPLELGDRSGAVAAAIRTLLSIA